MAGCSTMIAVRQQHWVKQVYTEWGLKVVNEYNDEGDAGQLNRCRFVTKEVASAAGRV